MKPPVNRLKAAAIGAAFSLSVALGKSLSGELPPRHLTYWAGTALGGALMGVLIAWLIDRHRRVR